MDYSKFNKYIFTTLSIVVFYSLFSPAYSESMKENLNDNIRLHQNIIKNKLEYYNEKFKDIKFIHLDGGDDWQNELDTTLKLLGDNAIALDYEHPKELQSDLMYVTIKRLKKMLEYDGISSTLFRVGDKNSVKQGKLCITTLNPKILINSNSAPLRFMLNYSDNIIKKIHPSKYIDSNHQY